MHAQEEYKDRELITQCKEWSVASDMRNRVFYLPLRETREDVVEILKRHLGA